MTDQTTETARALLYRHGLPEDVIDGALALHAQELAAVQRREAAVWGVDTAAGKHILAAADLIDPTKGPAPAVQQPPVDRAALRQRYAAAMAQRDGHPSWPTEFEDDERDYLRRADAAMAVADAELAAAVLPEPADRAAALREAADEAEAEAENAQCNAVGPCQQCSARTTVAIRLRRLADEAQQSERVAYRPQRGDEFERWLKAQRDSCFGHASSWAAVDGLLDRYRLHADTGTPLGEHVCEGQVVGDCECLEQPAKPTRTCADSGACFAPAGHYADCPAAGAQQPEIEAGA
ncbi:hypothetical protein HUT11_35480 (plasmid) [Streptomyces seoulensis]|nr:hypothetical protein HUT11_35480 [Streptomyces seoulensis]